MMLKAKQNSFLKWFIGIVLLIVALCSFMTTAFAAPDPSDVYICAICNERFAFFPCNVSEKLPITYQDYFSVQDIPGITNESSRFYVNGYGYVGPSDGKEVFVADYNGNPICYSCLEQKVAEYKAANSLNATVPASLPIHVGEDGKVTTASNASITNNGSKPIVISSINIAASSGWTVQSKVDATNAKAGSKVIAIGFNNSWATPNSGNASGYVNTSAFGKISASGTLNLAYDAVIPVATAGGSSDETAATATIVVAFPEAPTLAAGSGWYKSSEDITKITFKNSYTPTTTADETWAADAENKGTIKCYKTGTEVIIAGNGTGKIRANADSSFMFNTFPKLTTIENFGVLDTSNVTDMSSMFGGCSGLTSLDVSNFDTSNVVGMVGMFGGCSGLTDLDVSNFDTSNVIHMSNMFADCSGLTSLDISNFDTSTVLEMDGMFQGCSGLTTIYAGDGWNTDAVEESDGMFNECVNLEGDIQFDSSAVDKTYATTSEGYLTYRGQTATLAAGSGWYKSSENRNTITKITFKNSYTPTTTADETWAADVNGTGDITCYRTGTEIIIAGNGAGNILANPNSNYMFSYSKSGSGFKKLTAIENLRLLDTSKVISMGDMFYNCTELTSIDVSNFKTSNVTDMSEMFWNCTRLTSLDVSNFNTSNVTDMSWMFCYCGNVTNLDVSNWNTSNVTDMRDMFFNCKGVTNLDFSNWNTSNVTNMSDMFTYCEGLTNIDVSGFDTSKVTSMGGMFYNCTGLTSLDVSNFNTSNVTDMHWMFNNCEGLTNIDVSGFDTSKVTGMNRMFFECKALTSIDVSNFKTSNVTDMSEMFGYCIALTTIYAGDGWNTDSVENSDYMFIVCVNLKGDIAYNSSYTDKKYAKTSGGYLSLKPPTLAAGSEWYKSKVDKSTITKITFVDSYTATSYNETWNADVDNSGAIKCYRTGTEIIVAGNGRKKISANPSSQSMFSNFTALANLDTSVLDTTKVTNMAGMFSNCGDLTNLDISHFDTSNVTNMNSMFYGCSGLTTIDLSKWNTSKVSETVSMFYNCANLTNLDLSMWDMSNVKEVAFMFQKCSKLTSLNVSTWNTSKITSFNQMFYGCSGLTSLDVSKWNTSNARIMYAMFYHCSGLTSLNVSNWNTSNVTNMSTMFSGCSGLTSLDVSKWNTSNVTGMDRMFFSCEALSSLDVSNFKTSKVTNMEAMFYECRSVTNLDVSNWNTSNVTNMSTMFCYCGSVRNLDVSNFNTAKVTDMNYMFFNCKGVTNLDVSNWNTSNVTDMSDMFCYCEGLTSLDISIFDTRKVTDMSWMFAHCTGVTNIYVGDNWNTDKVTSSEYMFYNSRKLPNYNNSKFDVTMATFTSNGGYLTHKAATKSLKLNVDQSGTVNGYTEQSAA